MRLFLTIPDPFSLAHFSAAFEILSELFSVATKHLICPGVRVPAPDLVHIPPPELFLSCQ